MPVISGNSVLQCLFDSKGGARALTAAVIVCVSFLFPAFAASSPKKALVEAAPFFVDACRRSGKSEYLKIEGYESTVACVAGDIEDHSVTALRNWESADANLTIVANSRGGMARVAIELVEMWGVGKFDIIIAGVCHSGCANYLFAGANHKIILGRSPFSWHGGLPRNKEELRSMAYPGVDVPVPGDQSAEWLQALERSWFDFSVRRKRQKAIYDKQEYVEDIIYLLPAAEQCANEEGGEKMDELNSEYDDGDAVSGYWRPSRFVLERVFKFSGLHFQNPSLYENNIFQLRMDDGREFIFEFSTDCLVKNYDLHAPPPETHH